MSWVYCILDLCGACTQCEYYNSFNVVEIIINIKESFIAFVILFLDTEAIWLGLNNH